MEKNIWKNSTCELCHFRVDADCRRFPHWDKASEVKLSHDAKGDSVWNRVYLPACAEYKKEEQ